MSLFPIFGIRMLLLLVAPVFLAAIILTTVGKRGTSVFKKQGVAWGLTLLMVFAAIGIGYAKAPFNNPKPENVPAPTNAPIHDPVSEPGLQQGPGAMPSYVWDNAQVLSNRTVRELDERNLRLYDHYQTSIGVVTCNYGYDDLDEYGRDCAVEMGLGDYDMIVVLDISGENYWLLRGAGLEGDFSDQTCSDYAYDYMESSFAQGDYDSAVLQLTEMLEAWYGVYYF